LAVSPYCLGIVEDPRVIPAAFDAGINFFFLTADMHWPWYEKTRQGLRVLLARGGDTRDQVVVGVVTYVAQPEFCWMPLTEVLDAVPGLQRIDLSIVGGAHSGDYLPRLQEHHRHRAERWAGVRAVGTTFHDRAAARMAITHRMIDIAFVRYNVEHPGAEEDLFAHLRAAPRAHRPETPVPLLYNFKSTSGARTLHDRWQQLAMAPGDWRPDITDFYRFALTNPALDGALISLSRLPHLRELRRALDRGPLDEEERAYLVTLSKLARGEARRVI
jgi:hypothetical protein